MNKLFKGSLAAGAGTILLLGGAGTFMSWNADASINGGTVSTGHLNLIASEEPATWTVNDQPVDNIAAFPIVPGDTVEYTTNLGLEAEGENLTATLGLTGNAITPATGNTADVALEQALRTDAVLELTPTSNRVTANSDGSYDINAGTGAITEDITVTVTMDFPFDADTATHPDEAAMNGSVDLSGMSVNLTQTTANNS